LRILIARVEQAKLSKRSYAIFGIFCAPISSLLNALRTILKGLYALLLTLIWK
ncbi:MAG: hypothetical protein ACJAXH_002609, partial [Colwellia sp.]